MTIPSPDEITTVADVEAWFDQLIDAGYDFHPDDSMVLTCDERVRLGYRGEPGCIDPCPGHVQYDLAMDRAFEVADAAEVDIYGIGLAKLRTA